ncbi:MAG: hypothetical protein HY297_02950 [Thaumarchaeota archaeon]|nr:hypothetical protein [Nitrososphaerota archaeon]
MRYRFSTGTTSTAASTCASGTCSGWSFINYEQLENTYAVSANAQSTFDSGLTAQAVVGTVAGAGGTTVCTISINGGDSTDTQSTCWSDYNSSAVIGSSTIGGAPTNSQWFRSGSCSNTPSSGGNTYTCSYYKQWTNTFQTSANAQTLFDAGMTEAPLGNFAGSPSTQICTITTTASASNSCSGYSDANSAVTFDQLLTGAPSNTRWKNAAGAASSTGSITSGGNTFIVNYYKQLQNTYQASTNGQGPPTWDSGLAMPLSGTLLGSAGTVCTLSPSGSTITAVACTAYADYNAAVSAPSLATGSGSNIQWRLYGTSLYTDTTGGTTHTALLYYKQLQNTYTAAANAQSTFDSGLTFTVTGTLGGTDSQTICTIAPSSSDSTKSCAGYADYNLAVVMPTNPAGAGSDIRWQVSGASSFTDTSGGNSHSTDYYKQWSTTFSATANAQSTFDSGLSTSVTALSLGTSATVCTVSPDGGSASGSCSGYLDNSASASFGTTMSGAGTDTRWACQTCATAAVSSGGSTLTVNFFKQLQETFLVTLNLGDPLAGDTIVILGTFYGTGSSQILSLDVGGASIASSSAWLDYNTTASFPASSTDSGASERWGVSAASATSRITAGGETFSQDYYHQFLQTLSYSIVGGGTPTAPQASGSQFGSGYSPDLSSTPAGYWFDATGSIAFTNPLADSNSTERWQSETSSMSATSSATVALSFYHQNYLTLTSFHGTPNGAGWYDSGSVATFWVTPSTVSGGAGVRYVFAGWSSGDGGYNGTHRFSAHNMTRPVTETAIWRVQYYLSTRASPSWISSRFLVQPEAGWYDAGSKVTLTARSGPFRIAGGDNFYFSSWDVNGTSAGTWKAVVVAVSGRLLVSAHYLVPQSLRYSWSGPSELASDLPGNFQAEYNLTANVDLSSARLHGVLRRASGASAFTITCDGATVWTGSSLPMRRIAVAACGGTLTISRSSMTLTVGPMLSGESHKLSIRFTWSSHTTGRYVIMGSWSGISTNAYGNTRTPATQAFPVRVF